MDQNYLAMILGKRSVGDALFLQIASLAILQLFKRGFAGDLSLLRLHLCHVHLPLLFASRNIVQESKGV